MKGIAQTKPPKLPRYFDQVAAYTLRMARKIPTPPTATRFHGNGLDSVTQDAAPAPRHPLQSMEHSEVNESGQRPAGSRQTAVPTYYIILLKCLYSVPKIQAMPSPTLLALITNPLLLAYRRKRRQKPELFYTQGAESVFLSLSLSLSLSPSLAIRRLDDVMWQRGAKRRGRVATLGYHRPRRE
jgi:hypothetical protein